MITPKSSYLGQPQRLFDLIFRLGVRYTERFSRKLFVFHPYWIGIIQIHPYKFEAINHLKNLGKILRLAILYLYRWHRKNLRRPVWHPRNWRHQPPIL
jgi:hypothetical protein